MLLRLCLKDKSSVLIEGYIENIGLQVNTKQFIEVVNYNTGKVEMYNRDFIWCIRQSSKNKGE